MQQNIKKVIVPPENLLAVNVADDLNSQVSQYLVRYRIVSEDKTRTSSWSPIYHVMSRTISDILTGQTVKYVVMPYGDRIEVSWVIPDVLKITSYDVYVQWQDASNNPIGKSGDTNLYPYVDTSTTGFLSIPVPTNLTTTVKYAKIWIQASTFPKNRSVAAKVVETGNVSTTYRIAGGSIA